MTASDSNYVTYYEAKWCFWRPTLQPLYEAIWVIQHNFK